MGEGGQEEKRNSPLYRGQGRSEESIMGRGKMVLWGGGELTNTALLIIRLIRAQSTIFTAIPNYITGR